MTMMTDEAFAEIVSEAFHGLPEEFISKIENIDIIIEDYPSAEIQQSMRVTRHGLLGLYSGIPQKHRSPFYYGNVLPDRIYLYQKNIESICRSREEMKEQIQRTLLHEVGHYFGIDDRRLRELGF